MFWQSPAKADQYSYLLCHKVLNCLLFMMKILLEQNKLKSRNNSTNMNRFHFCWSFEFCSGENESKTIYGTPDQVISEQNHSVSMDCYSGQYIMENHQKYLFKWENPSKPLSIYTFIWFMCLLFELKIIRTITSYKLLLFHINMHASFLFWGIVEVKLTNWQLVSFSNQTE